jgi:hypothetical protein
LLILLCGRHSCNLDGGRGNCEGGGRR